MPKPLVIVESPTKQKLIQKFLGSDYVVEASVGHIRDLPEPKSLPADMRKGPFGEFAVDIADDFKPFYTLDDDPRKRANIANLKAKLKDSSVLYLATDEDREGESISWHLKEVLKPKIPVKRMVFHEITEEAIKDALSHSRSIDEDLVSAQETRRVIDRLFGYATSRVLWRKLTGVKSAGRVQTPAVRILVERERARMAFRSGTWWGLDATFRAGNSPFPGALNEVGGKRIATGKDFDENTGRLKSNSALLLDEKAANALSARLRPLTAKVVSVEAKPWKDGPGAPFTTSTLQQEANRKMRWGADLTMKMAQRLYESGWITYMRTDSVVLSDQALTAARSLIREQYGAEYLPAQPRRFPNRSKNAQEAHEAIRPAGARFRSIDDARRELGNDEAKLYELIWKRTVASQMAEATGARTAMVIAVDDARFNASGLNIQFPGYRRAYVEGSDDPEAELADEQRILPSLKVGDVVAIAELSPKGHTTQPPARLTEASLIKRLEELGIGRPSTYADIMKKIVDRGYAFRKSNALIPTYVAFLLSAFLESQLSELAAFDFTSRLEDDLDKISLGKAKRIAVLTAFYHGDRGLRARLDSALAAEDRGFYRLPISGEASGELHVRVGQFGAYVTDGARTANVPPEFPPDEVTAAWALAQLDKKAEGPNKLGDAPTGEPIFLMDGRFGPYVQKGEATKDEKPPRASLLPGMTPADVTLEIALRLLTLPRTLGKDKGEPVIATLGRYGPYVKRGSDSRSIPAGKSVLEITLAEALTILAEPARKGRASIEPLTTLGPDPVSGKDIRVMKGRFGPYVTDGETNATLPKSKAPESVTVEEAAELLARRREAGPSVKRGRFAKKGGAKASAGAAKSAGATGKAGAAKSATKAGGAKSAGAKSATGKAGAAKSASGKAGAAKAAGATGQAGAAKATTKSKGATANSASAKTSSAKRAAKSAAKSASGKAKAAGVTAKSTEKASAAKPASANSSSAKGSASSAAKPVPAAVAPPKTTTTRKRPPADRSGAPLDPV